MKKLLAACAMLALLTGGALQAEEAKKAPTAEEKARETCTKKGLTGTWLEECVKNELSKSGQTTTVPNTTGTAGKAQEPAKKSN